MNTVQLLDCEFIGNSLQTDTDYYEAGGGAWLLAEDIAVTNCLFLNNILTDPNTSGGSGVQDGCGLFTAALTEDGRAHVTNCTFVGNSRNGTSSGGYYGAVLQMWGPGFKQVVNTVSGFNNINFPDNPEANIQFSISSHDTHWPVDPDAGQYLVRDICIWHPTEPDHLINVDGFDDYEIWYHNRHAVIKVDPGFVDVEGNDMHLGDGSPLIDAGYNFVDVDPALPGIQFLPELDLDGNLRIVDGDGDGVTAVDIGVYEYSP